MARSLVRVRPAGSSSCSGGTIDMVYFESEMATSSDPSDGGTVWAVTMLVGANAANAQLGCADDPGFALIGLVPRRLRLAGSGWEGELEGLVASFVPCRASLILMLPRAEASSQHHVQRILRILNGARNLD